MTPRDRRLFSDRLQMEDLADRGQISFTSEGDPPELYHLEFEAPGVACERGLLVAVHSHRCDAYLHRDYPRRPPVFEWKTPVFHPNLLGPDRNGGVCIGSWSPSESLADLIVRLVSLVSWKSFNPDDPLDLDAAMWANDHRIEPGVSVDRLVGSSVESVDNAISMKA